MEKGEKKFRTFNFINSIKGGSGKTTFSVLLALYLSRMDKEGNLLDYGSSQMRENAKKVVTFDMDFQGTSMQYLFEGRTTSQETRYINDAVWDSAQWEKYISNVEMKDGAYLRILYADSSIKAKKKYRVAQNAGYSPMVQHQVFRTCFKEYLKKFEAEDFRHLIFDLPPNSDGFSDAALSCVLDDDKPFLKTDDKINLIYMVSPSWGHSMATLSEIVDCMQNKKAGVRYFVVFNMGMYNCEDLAGLKGQFISFWAEYKKELSSNLSFDNYKNIHFFVMNNLTEYTHYTIFEDGLKNKSKITAEKDIMDINSYLEMYASLEKGFEKLSVLGKGNEFLYSLLI